MIKNETLKEIYFFSENNRIDMSEVAVTHEHDEAKNLAIFLVKQGGAFMAVVYSPIEFDEYIVNPTDDRFIKGMIRSYEDKSLKAYEVKIVAALRGYGPMLYQLLSSRIGWIVSDRKEVTDMAQNIWKWMYDHPESWMKEKLNTTKELPTVLDFKYKWLKSSSVYGTMISANEVSKKSLAKKHSLSVKEIEQLLVTTAEEFFDKRFF